MPLYKNPAYAKSITAGDQEIIVNNERLSQLPGFGLAPSFNFSQRVAISDKDGMPPRPIVVTFTYAMAPASVQYDIFVALDDTGPLTSYTKIGSTTNVNGDQITIQRNAAGGNQFRFICVREVIDPGAGSQATIKVQQ